MLLNISDSRSDRLVSFVNIKDILACFTTPNQKDNFFFLQVYLYTESEINPLISTTAKKSHHFFSSEQYN